MRSDIGKAFVSLLLFLCMTGEGEAKTIILGKSKIVVPHGALVGTQVDRVIRDIAWTGSAFDGRVDPARIPADRTRLVPYMEGHLSGLLMEYAGARVEGLGPVEAELRDGWYFADDGEGTFRFRVDPSKTEYGTTVKKGNGRMILPDTHGFNMVAGPAVRRSRSGKIHLVIACMDLPSKAEAALHLAKRGIHCYGPCDRFICDLVGYRRSRPDIATILGTAPVRKLSDGRAVIGDQPVPVDSGEKIVVEDAVEQKYPSQYSDAPFRYFTALDREYGLGLQLFPVPAAPGDAKKVIGEAERIGASVVGVRIWDTNDADAVSGWLSKSKKHRAILSHSAIYDAGLRMFDLFPKQVSFADPDPEIVNVGMDGIGTAQENIKTKNREES